MYDYTVRTFVPWEKREYRIGWWVSQECMYAYDREGWPPVVLGQGKWMIKWGMKGVREVLRNQGFQ